MQDMSMPEHFIPLTLVHLSAPDIADVHAYAEACARKHAEAETETLRMQLAAWVYQEGNPKTGTRQFWTLTQPTGPKANEATALYAVPFGHAKELERFRWLKEDATAEQWGRVSHALDVDAEIDAIRRGEMT